MEVDEDPAYAHTGGGGIDFAPNPDGDGATWRGSEGGGRAKEGCSCLYGNPCMDQYVCNDWGNRFDVAKRNGWKG